MVRESSSSRFVTKSFARTLLTDGRTPLAMNNFKSGPPGGKTIPSTAIKLSDLIGGVYGPGASVASTGFNSQRPVVKAASSRAAGDTWEDVLEYYMVRISAIARVVPMTRVPLVQRRPRGNRFCIPTWEDPLPGLAIPITWRYCFRKRRCGPYTPRLRTCNALLLVHRQASLAHRSARLAPHPIPFSRRSWASWVRRR